MRAMVVVVVLLLLATSLAACGIGGMRETGVVGDGQIVTETRGVDDFDRVLADNGAAVILVVDPGATGEDFVLAVTGDSNLLEYVVTEVDAGTLTVTIDGPSGGISTANQLEVAATVPRIVAATADNGAIVDLAAEAEGGPELAVSVDNGGVAHLGGSADGLTVSADNGGGVRGESMNAAKADVELDNGSVATLCVAGEVVGQVSNGAALTVLCGGSVAGVTTSSAGEVSTGP